jgi:hypothetical protein
LILVAWTSNAGLKLSFTFMNRIVAEPMVP